MLTESEDVRQAPGEPHRRWFSDDHFDLIVWSDKDAATLLQLFQERSLNIDPKVTKIVCEKLAQYNPADS